MSEEEKRPRAPSWAPRRVLDVAAQEADRPLLEKLHGATVAAVEPFFLARVESLAGEVVAADLTRQGDALRVFMLGELREDLSPVESNALRDAVVPFLEDRMKTDMSPANVERKLVAQLAIEFAGSMWSTLLSRLSKKYGGGNRTPVPPSELLPDNPLTGTTPLLQQVADDTRHFGLMREELNTVMAKTLDRLVMFGHGHGLGHDSEHLLWPLGIRVERKALAERIQQTTWERGMGGLGSGAKRLVKLVARS